MQGRMRALERERRVVAIKMSKMVNRVVPVVVVHLWLWCAARARADAGREDARGQGNSPGP